MKSMKYFPRALHYLKPYKKLAIASVVLLVVSALLPIIIPLPLKYLIDSVLDHARSEAPQVLTAIG